MNFKPLQVAVPPGAQPLGYSLTPAQKAVVLFLVGFLVVFPKGGIKLAGVPLTWGYLGLGVLTAALLPVALLSGRLGQLPRTRLLTLGALLPFQAISLLAFGANGIESTGFAISFLTTFLVIPAVFVLLFGNYLERIDLSFLFRLLRVGIPLVAAYGIFLFFYRLFTGSFIEIPFLTVNLGDVGGLEDKYIDRGGIFKLISTYNNGNIYGICILMLLPLYAWLEPRWTRRGLVKASLVLTLSRTVWLGLIFYELLSRVYIRRISLRGLASLAAVLVLLGAAVLYALRLLGVGAGFLLDRNLGGRADQLEHLRQAGLFSDVRFAGITEMVYLSVLHNFGWVGLIAFLVAITVPLLLYFLRYPRFSTTEYKRALAGGLMIYLFVAVSDGAILFIPVMAFYWALVALLLSPNASFFSERPTASAGAAGPPT